MGDVRHGAQFGAEAPDRRRRDGGAEIRRQLALGHRLDRGEHVGRAASVKVAAHQLGRHRHADAREFLRRNRGRDRLAVDEHTVAIEDDHGCPRAAALVTQSDESLWKDTNRAVVAKVGQGRSGPLLHSFLIPLGIAGDDTLENGELQEEVG